MSQTIASRLRVVGQTDVGCVRTLNEDSFCIDDEVGVLMVADGMGGHAAGEIASARVIKEMLQLLAPLQQQLEELSVSDQPHIRADDPHHPDSGEGNTLPRSQVDYHLNQVLHGGVSVLESVTQTIQQVNTVLYTINDQAGYGDGGGMGSTLVGVWLPMVSARPVLFHVGDSRCYLFRSGRLRQLTEDHTLYQHWIRYGRHGPEPARNIVLQAMGPSDTVEPDVHYQDVQVDDILLLCSDGLTGMITENDISRILNTTSATSLELACSHLVDLARKQGGRDNITVILAHVVR
ncbi:MAG: serine/threonine-protein phosphatase [Magnetococcales bacterium]|nr:serine/threonine-protein phosphatase [Magnetococcales bacterium]